ncbi:uncharacterized protein C2845_PM03G22790 [Panicum miliaceum]|uniref:F-box domain-containing protein n=1 Tax=Panicum miliaceum TaxID=4540 RepID=A0A3L6TD94_PANMI|nr:uncharacterized protein C2845_PM03G22790 [Panicum miliaceum]
MVLLTEEVVEEILLRFPPAEPASLVRAALVCKPWCRLISGRRFHRRFREFHRSPPVLGFLGNLVGRRGPAPRFFPASPACPPLADLERWRWLKLEARHGRVLLGSEAFGPPHLVVWDPVTGKRWELPPPSDVWHPNHWNAAVLCAASGGACDHLHCRGVPFLVVFVGSDAEQISLCTYSSEAGSWSEPTFAATAFEYAGGVDRVPTALVGNSLYFMIDMGYSMLGYDLITRKTSVIDHTPAKSIHDPTEPMVMEDGGILVAVENYNRLFLWSMEEKPKGDIVWAQIRVIELNKLLPANALPNALPVYANCFAFVCGVGILVGTNGRLCIIDLKSD